MVGQIMPFSEAHVKNSRNYFLILFSLGVATFLIYLFVDIIAMLAISVLLGLIFNPIVDFLEHRGLHRTLSVLFVFLGLVTLIVAGFSFLAPKIINQMNTLTTALTQENVQLLIQQFEKSLKSIFPFLGSVDLTQKISDLFQNILVGWVNNLTNVVQSIVSILAVVVVVPFMTFFLLKDNKRLMRGIINVMPNKYFEVSYSVIRKISISLGRFVRGWLLDAFCVGLLSGLGLAFLGIHNAASIGLVAGMGHLIPYFGPIIGGIPAIAMSLIQFGNFSMLPRILLMFLCVYLIDNGFIQPNVFSKSTDMHPLVIIVLIIAGSQLLGIMGMLLAVPIATIIKTAAREIYFGYKNYKIIQS
jgi:predicted PurR-regulated permease PerM